MEELKLLTDNELMFLGVQNLAYVKPVQADGNDLFVIYSADGTEIGTAEDKGEVRLVLLKNNLRPVALH